MPRLFTGLDLPIELKRHLTGLRGGLSNVRWIDPENYHVTLRFIGDVSNDMAEEIDYALQAERAEKFQIQLRGLGTFGKRKADSVWARVLNNDALNELQRGQENCLRRLGLEPERRQYKPHVTLARLRDIPSRIVGEYIELRSHLVDYTFEVDNFVLFSSKPSYGGGPYIAERTYQLG